MVTDSSIGWRRNFIVYRPATLFTKDVVVRRMKWTKKRWLDHIARQ
jgi:hypothetical protein